MGDFQSGEPSGNAAFQEHLVRVIREEQAADALAAVTLVIDDAAQGWALRRQVARRLPLGAAMANVRTVTVRELLDQLALAIGTPGAQSPDSTLRVAVTESLLRRQTGLLAASKDHPDTAVRLGGLYDELEWCPLGDDALAALDPAGVSTTSQAAIGFVAQARTELATALGERTMSRVAEDVRRRLQSPGAAAAVRQFGSIIVTATCLPAPIDQALQELSSLLPVARIAPVPVRALRPAAIAYECPDPGTEAAMAARIVAAALAGGTPPSRIAVLYPVDQPYARLLEGSLDEAGIQWHGPTGLTLQATAVARFVTCLATMAAARALGGSGITRPLLMTWLSIGAVYAGSDRQPTGAYRALIRQEGLYADARLWRARLGALAAAAQADEDADDEESSARRRNRLGGFAAGLEGVIERLDAALASMDAADTWTGLGAALWSALERFHLQGTGWQVADAERAAYSAVRQVLLESLPGIDVFLAATGDTGLPPRASDAALMLERALAHRRSRRGASGTGIHVGTVTSTRGLVFDHVVVVGAAEGLLPTVRAEDPLLPDVARGLLRTVRDDLPTSAEREQALGDVVRSLCGSTTQLAITFARGAIPGRAVAKSSRYFSAAAPPIQVASARSGLRIAPHPIAPIDLAIRQSIGAAAGPAELAAQGRCVAAWARPDFDRYFGHPGTVDGLAAWTTNDLTLSASAIESYLYCPYHFFVRRVLGITTDEYADDVDEVSPSDMGLMLHRVLERFVNDSRDRGCLPPPGGPWPATALPDLLALLDDEVRKALALGITGWPPAWERTLAVVRSSLAAFLAIDAADVRSEPPVAPAAAEVAFGMDGAPTVEFSVRDDVVVHLRGSIDRVDVGIDPTHAGVVDYKSGRADTFAGKLGMPKSRGKVADREKVQDLVYDVALHALRPELLTVDVRFLFVPNDGDPTVVNADHEPDRSARLQTVLQSLEEAGSAGAFPPKPKGRQDYCPVCTRLGGRAHRVAGRLGTLDEPGEEVTP